MEYNKETNIFYEIDYANEVLFYENECPKGISPTTLKINLKNQDLKKAVVERYEIKKFPALLYYKKILYIKEDITDFPDEDLCLKEEVERIIKSGKIVLFMKGEINNPYCQFSRQVVNILKENISDLDKVIYYDVLMNEEMRKKIKEVNEWPTFPQLFVNGEFIGGCDILKSMDKSELQRILN